MAVLTKPADVASVLAWRYGLPTDKAFGISVAALRKYAKALGPDHALAMQLWKTGWLDARILASFLAEPRQLTLTSATAAPGCTPRR